MKGQFFLFNNIDEHIRKTPLHNHVKGRTKINIFWSSLLYILQSRQKKKRRGEIFINPSRFFAFFIINSWYIKAWLVVWLSFRWWFFRMKWHVVWQFEFIKIFVASSVLCTDLEKGIFFFILRVFPVF